MYSYFKHLFVGSWPRFTIMSSEDVDLNVQVTQDVKGVPSYKTITLTYDDVRASPVRANAEATEVKMHITVYSSTAKIIAVYAETYFLL